MTTRERSIESPAQNSLLVKTWNGNPFDTHSALLSSYTKVMVDETVRGYRRRIANGEIINNPCSLSVSDRYSGNGTYYGISDDQSNVFEASGGSLSSYHRTFDGSFEPLSAADIDYNLSEMIKQAKLYAIANIDPTPSAFAEDAFEIRETLKFIRSPLTGIANLAKSFQRKRYKLYRRNKVASLVAQQKPEIVKAVSDLWLQYRFAASPLLRSVMDGVDAFQTRNEKHTFPERLVSRGIQKANTSLSESPTSDLGNGVYQSWETSLDAEADVAVGILYTVTNPVDNLQWRLGLRVKDVPETLWQVVPLSFMADRVWDVSKLIRGMTNLVDPQVRLLAGWVRVKEKVVTNYRLSGQTVPGYTVTANGDTVHAEDFSYTRTPWSPSPLDTWPSITLGRLVEDATSIADLATLAYSRLVG